MARAPAARRADRRRGVLGQGGSRDQGADRPSSGWTAGSTLRPGYVPADQIPGLFAADRRARAARTVPRPHRRTPGSRSSTACRSSPRAPGTLADAVRDGVDGIVCEPGDEDDLLRALVRISAPGEADRLRSAVQAADPGGYWDAYLEALLSFAAPAGAGTPRPEADGPVGTCPRGRYLVPRRAPSGAGTVPGAAWLSGAVPAPGGRGVAGTACCGGRSRRPARPRPGRPRS